MLDVGDVDVLNTLINKCSVESILLIEQRAEASHVIERQHVHGMLSVSGFSVAAAIYLCRSDCIIYEGLSFLPGIHTRR